MQIESQEIEKLNEELNKRLKEYDDYELAEKSNREQHEESKREVSPLFRIQDDSRVENDDNRSDAMHKLASSMENFSSPLMMQNVSSSKRGGNDKSSASKQQYDGYCMSPPSMPTSPLQQKINGEQMAYNSTS